ncbi:hypothetical protein CAAN1_13S01134 [[Candida] anglica]|uniref:Zn(2)-C6 fungal-type domain-containing protein n=1 Tax=[Candida] anglica TaxID=148631 RepID=A0ABP0EKK4_9ASCO
MAEIFPISCLACRRLKIRCNRVKPCNQCTRRSIVCEYPSTFRNTIISSQFHDEYNNNGISVNTTTPNKYLNEELQTLKENQEKILRENAKLNAKNKDLITKLESSSKGKGSSSGGGSSAPSLSISGETSELGEKYYGPLSSAYMIDNLKVQSEEQNIDSKSKNENVESEFTNKKAIEIPEIHRRNAPKAKELAKSAETENQIANSLVKKPLPRLISNGGNNLTAIKTLVNLFFQQNIHYQTFISRSKVLAFLQQHKSIKDKEWEHDDDLLLLYMILFLSIQRLTPKEFQKIGLLDNQPVGNFRSRKEHITMNVLYHSFEELRHNLINESILTIQSYILCTELYLIEQRYEESWSMMFHTCSIAYAIGLHAMRKLRLQNVSSRIQRRVTINNESSSDDLEEDETDVERFKVWFALKNICGQICSTLGRPNPISIQVNAVLLKSLDSKDFSSIDYSERTAQVLLKTGLSECLRLSNMMLIENFMIDFTMDDLVKLNNRFDIEIKILEWYQSGRAPMETDSNSDKDFPNRIDNTNLLTDLIILYINRAKLFEPFVNKFTGPAESRIISDMLRYSILKFLDYTLMFINLFFENCTERYYEFIDEGSDVRSPDTKFGKLLRVYYPFLNSFVYQGIIVLFTFLHYKFKDFVSNFDQVDRAVSTTGIETINYNLFLNQVDTKLNFLLSFGAENEQYKNIKLWSSNIVQLIVKVREHISMIFRKQKQKSEYQKELFEKELNEFQKDLSGAELEDYYGFDINDPFWLRNPGNFPYYLSSPSDDNASTVGVSSTRGDFNENSGDNKSAYSSNSRSSISQSVNLTNQQDMMSNSMYGIIPTPSTTFSNVSSGVQSTHDSNFVSQPEQPMSISVPKLPHFHPYDTVQASVMQPDHAPYVYSQTVPFGAPATNSQMFQDYSQTPNYQSGTFTQSTPTYQQAPPSLISQQQISQRLPNEYHQNWLGHDGGDQLTEEEPQSKKIKREKCA